MPVYNYCGFRLVSTANEKNWAFKIFACIAEVDNSSFLHITKSKTPNSRLKVLKNGGFYRYLLNGVKNGLKFIFFLYFPCKSEYKLQICKE